MSDVLSDELRMPDPLDTDARQVVQNLITMRRWDDPGTIHPSDDPETMRPWDYPGTTRRPWNYPGSPNTIRWLVRNWDKVILPQLMDLHANRLLRAVQRLVKDEHLAADLVQGAWLILFQEYMARNAAVMRLVDDETCDSQELYHWLRAVVSHGALNYLKREQFLRSLGVEEWGRCHHRAFETGESYLMRELAYTVLNEAIQVCLNPIQRKAFLLHVAEGYSDEEVSWRLGIPLNTAKSHIRRASKLLREACEAQNIGPEEFRNVRAELVSC